MELSKQQRLYDTLQKLAPKGKFGGLGSSGLGAASRKRSDSLPDNPLYANFIRAGAGHKRTFKEEDDTDDASSEDAPPKKKQKDKKGEAVNGEGAKPKSKVKKEKKDDQPQKVVYAKCFDAIEERAVEGIGL